MATFRRTTATFRRPTAPHSRSERPDHDRLVHFGHVRSRPELTGCRTERSRAGEPGRLRDNRPCGAGTGGPSLEPRMTRIARIENGEPARRETGELAGRSGPELGPASRRREMRSARCPGSGDRGRDPGSQRETGTREISSGRPAARAFGARPVRGAISRSDRRSLPDASVRSPVAAQQSGEPATATGTVARRERHHHNRLIGYASSWPSALTIGISSDIACAISSRSKGSL